MITHHERGSLIETSEDIKELAAYFSERIDNAAKL